MKAALEPAIERILAAHPGGLSEHQLLCELRARGVAGVPRQRLGTGLRLFRVHFMLFHNLYRLRDRLHRERRGDIAIHPLHIVLRPGLPAGSGVVEHDPVRAYYLDLRNLERVSEANVHKMLAEAFRLFDRRRHRAAALGELGLSDPVDHATIKRRYRRLAMHCHPDRGGDKHRFQAINRAFELLASGSD